MRLLAISDLHIGITANRVALLDLPGYPDDWLIVAGDLSESLNDIDFAFAALAARFAKVIFTPGNHDLWITSASASARGVARYDALVAIARAHGVVTPEDPPPVWTGPGGPVAVAPLFLLYDYSFRPPFIARADVVEWAREERSVCADELYLDPAPYDSRDAWCEARVALTAARLSALPDDLPTVLVNHYPLRRDLVRIPRIPRFSPWCGTVLTEDWHRRFRARAVVSGHLHVRHTDVIDGTRFEEVSLGYTGQWDRSRGIAGYLREILPGPA